MWDGKFVVKNAMEQTCKIEIYLRRFRQFLCRLLARSGPVNLPGGPL